MLPKIITAAAIVFILVFIFVSLPRHKTNANKQNLIVFFGNSITAGQAAGAGEDFPTLVGKNLNVPVINAGISGNTTADALKRIDRDVLDKNPSIVVVELGGNDLLQGVNVNVTKRNFDLILTKIKSTNAKIVILGIKFYLFKGLYETDLQNFAKKYNAVLVPDIMEGIIDDQNLKHDDIHPNAKGYRKIADKLTPIIAPLLN